MAFGAFVSGVMQPTIDKYKAEQAMKSRLEEHASQAKLDKALNEWEYYSPEERNAVAPELDKILKQKKGYSADLLGRGGQAYDFLKGALNQQQPIQDLESSAANVSARPINLPGQMAGPESLDAVEPGGFERSATPINLSAKPISLPPLPIEGADIPRVDRNVLQMPPSQRASAMKDYRTRQSEMLARQSKLGEVGTSSMDPSAQEVATENLTYVPAGVLAARERAAGRNNAMGGKDIGLGIIELTSPDGKQKIMAQATRGRGYIDSSTGQPIDPAAVAGWTKVYHQGLQTFTNQEGNLDILNKEELQRRMSRNGDIVGNVPDIRPAENLTPVTTPTGQITGTIGSRTGQFRGPKGTGPAGPPIYKSALSDSTQNTISQLKNFQASLNEIQPLVEKFGNKVGRISGNLEKGAAWAGIKIPGTNIGGDPKMDQLITTLQDMKNTFIYLNTGKQINRKEMERLDAVMPDIGSPPARFKNNLQRFRRTLDTMLKVREQGRMEGATEAELAGVGAVPANTNRRQPASGGHTVGERRVFPNGAVGVWDGKGWKKQ